MPEQQNNKAMISESIIIDSKKSEILIRQNQDLVRSSHQQLGIMSERILMYLSYLMKKGHKDRIFRFDVKELMLDIDCTSKEIYRDCAEALSELQNCNFLLKYEDKGFIRPLNLICTETLANETYTSYRNGKMIIVLNNEIWKMMTESKFYTSYDFVYASSISNVYALRLFQIFSSYKNWREIVIDINDYRYMMGCNALTDAKGRVILKKGKPIVKYEKTADLILNTTNYAQVKFEKERKDYAFDIKLIYDETATGRGRKPIKYIKFIMKNRKVEKLNNTDYDTLAVNLITAIGESCLTEETKQSARDIYTFFRNTSIPTKVIYLTVEKMIEVLGINIFRDKLAEIHNIAIKKGNAKNYSFISYKNFYSETCEAYGIPMQNEIFNVKC